MEINSYVTKLTRTYLNHKLLSLQLKSQIKCVWHMALQGVQAGQLNDAKQTCDKNKINVPLPLYKRDYSYLRAHSYLRFIRRELLRELFSPPSHKNGYTTHY